MSSKHLLLALLLLTATAQAANEVEILWPVSTPTNAWTAGNHTSADEYFKPDHLDYFYHTGIGISSDIIQFTFSDIFSTGATGTVDSAVLVYWVYESAIGSYKNLRIAWDVGNGMGSEIQDTVNGTTYLEYTTKLSNVVSDDSANALQVYFICGTNLSSSQVRISWVYVRVYHTRTVTAPTVAWYNAPTALRSYTTTPVACSLYVGSSPIDTLLIAIEETGSSWWRRVWGPFVLRDYVGDPTFYKDTLFSPVVTMPYYNEDVTLRAIAIGRDGGRDTALTVIAVTPGLYDSVVVTGTTQLTYMYTLQPTFNYGGLGFAILSSAKDAALAREEYRPAMYVPGIASMAAGQDSLNYVLKFSTYIGSGLIPQAITVARSGKYFNVGASTAAAAADSEITWSSNLYNYETWTTGGGDWTASDTSSGSGDSTGASKVPVFLSATNSLADGDSLLILRGLQDLTATAIYLSDPVVYVSYSQPATKPQVIIIGAVPEPVGPPKFNRMSDIWSDR